MMNAWHADLDGISCVFEAVALHPQFPAQSCTLSKSSTLTRHHYQHTSIVSIPLIHMLMTHVCVQGLCQLEGVCGGEQ